MNHPRLIIAIDGPSGAGKSTVAKELARRLGYLYIDTGAMYRAVGLRALELDPALSDPAQIIEVARQSRIELKASPTGQLAIWLDDRDVSQAVRAEKVSQAASIVSSIPEVRRILVRAQQKMGASRGIVMEGRDIGTKVFPDAEIKVFLDASEETRARRRLEDNRAKGVRLSLQEMMAEIHSRDQRDTLRADSPLVQAGDAVYLDTSSLSVEEVVQRILRLVEQRLKRPSP
ncbi:MAG: (d)CMP kinase [Acidobacteriota bacterium]